MRRQSEDGAVVSLKPSFLLRRSPDTLLRYGSQIRRQFRERYDKTLMVSTLHSIAIVRRVSADVGTPNVDPPALTYLMELTSFRWVAEGSEGAPPHQPPFTNISHPSREIYHPFKLSITYPILI